MGETLRPPQDGWQPLIERALSQLAHGSIDLRSVWLEDAQQAASARGLRQLLDLVVLWNQRVDLTAARSPEELIDLYLADALVLAARAADSARQRWTDVGTGAGAPGLVLQLLRPELALTLVEPRAKRVAFLRTALGQLRLRAQLVAGRSESLGAGECDVAVSRATFPPEQWLAEGARLARQAVWVLLARGTAPSLPGWELAEQVDYEWPLTRVPRRALRFARTPSGTP
jgi:16S rRNA (guanine527-N7)-methyltransferase